MIDFYGVQLPLWEWLIIWVIVGAVLNMAYHWIKGDL